MRRGVERALRQLVRGLNAAGAPGGASETAGRQLSSWAPSSGAQASAPPCGSGGTLACGHSMQPGSGTTLGWRVPRASIYASRASQAVQTRGMFIQTQPTPNPDSLMFMPGQKVMESGSHEFSNARAGMASPLAKRLFTIDGVTSVFFGSDFITIKKQDGVSWAVLKPQVFEAIMDHASSGAPLFYDQQALAADDTAIHEDDDEVVAMIKELLETRIRPAVQEDGGDISFRSWDPDSGTVMVKMMGACSGCPSSTVTLKSGIENMLMHYIPEVKHVIEDVDEEEGGEEVTASTTKESPLAQHLSN